MSKNDITGDKLVSKALSEEGRANFDLIFGKTKDPDPLEKVIEAKVCEYARSKGVLAIKFNSMNRAAVPDRLFIAPINVIWFCEFKRGGQKPTPAQHREHERLRALGCTVFVIDTVEAGKEMVDHYA